MVKDQIPQRRLRMLKNETCILSRWREYFEDLLNPVKVNDLNTYDVIQPGEIRALTAAEVATAIKQLISGKASGGDKIEPEMLKAFA